MSEDTRDSKKDTAKICNNRRSSILKSSRPLVSLENLSHGAGLNDERPCEKRRVSFNQNIMVKEFLCQDNSNTSNPQEKPDVALISKDQLENVYMACANESFYQMSTPVGSKKRRITSSFLPEHRLSVIPQLDYHEIEPYNDESPAICIPSTSQEIVIDQIINVNRFSEESSKGSHDMSLTMQSLPSSPPPVNTFVMSPVTDGSKYIAMPTPEYVDDNNYECAVVVHTNNASDMSLCTSLDSSNNATCTMHDKSMMVHLVDVSDDANTASMSEVSSVIMDNKCGTDSGDRKVLELNPHFVPGFKQLPCTSMHSKQNEDAITQSHLKRSFDLPHSVVSKRLALTPICSNKPLIKSPYLDDYAGHNRYVTQIWDETKKNVQPGGVSFNSTYTVAPNESDLLPYTNENPNQTFLVSVTPEKLQEDCVQVSPLEVHSNHFMDAHTTHLLPKDTDIHVPNTVCLPKSSRDILPISSARRLCDVSSKKDTLASPQCNAVCGSKHINVFPLLKENHISPLPMKDISVSSLSLPISLQNASFLTHTSNVSKDSNIFVVHNTSDNDSHADRCNWLTKDNSVDIPASIDGSVVSQQSVELLYSNPSTPMSISASKKMPLQSPIYISKFETSNTLDIQTPEIEIINGTLNCNEAPPFSSLICGNDLDISIVDNMENSVFNRFILATNANKSLNLDVEYEAQQKLPEANQLEETSSGQHSFSQDHLSTVDNQSIKNDHTVEAQQVSSNFSALNESHTVVEKKDVILQHQEEQQYQEECENEKQTNSSVESFDFTILDALEIVHLKLQSIFDALNSRMSSGYCTNQFLTQHMTHLHDLICSCICVARCFIDYARLSDLPNSVTNIACDCHNLPDIPLSEANNSIMSKLMWTKKVAELMMYTYYPLLKMIGNKFNDNYMWKVNQWKKDSVSLEINNKVLVMLKLNVTALCSLNLVCHKVNGVSFQSKNGEMLEYLMGVPLKYKSSVVEIPMMVQELFSYIQ